MHGTNPNTPEYTYYINIYSRNANYAAMIPNKNVNIILNKVLYIYGNLHYQPLQNCSKHPFDYLVDKVMCW